MAKTLLPVDEAVALVVKTALAMRASRPAATRTTTIWEASGYVLAADVAADRPLPPFDKSMMDGYALRSQDLAPGWTTLELVGEVAAGEVGRAIGPGQALAIMTGAPLPEGADAVQVHELCERPLLAAGDRPSVIVREPVKAGANVALTGVLARAGQVVVEKGRIIESLTAGVLASVGAAQVEVFRRPRVTVVATGDELVNIDEVPGIAQIRDSNRKTLMALAEAEWCRVVDGGIARDDRPHLRSVIRDGLESDVLVLSGGVSAGSHDHVRECLESEGVEILFHQIAIKPGKPALFGRTAKTLVFGLPGNPVSNFVTAALLLTPAVRILGRRPDHRPWMLRLPLARKDGEAGTVALGATGRRTTFHPGHLVRIEPDGGHGGFTTELAVRPCGWDGSADHVAYARGNVLIRCEVGDPAKVAGDIVSVVLPRSLVDW